MLVFDMGVQVTVGGVWALSERERLIGSDTSPWQSRAFRHGLLYSALLYVPSAVFFLYAWPGWNSMYLLDIETDRVVGAWYAFANTMVLFACYLAGFAFASRTLKAKNGAVKPLLGRLGIMWAAILIVLFGLMWGRSFAVTSYQSFVAGDWPRFAIRWGEPDSFFGHALMYWLMLWAVLDFGPLGYLYWRARKRA